VWRFFALAGSAVELPAIAGSFGIPVTIVPLHTCGERQQLIHPKAEQGDLNAKALLGRPTTSPASLR